MLPDQTATLNESWLCFINRGENIRTADTNNFLIFISYSSFKVRFISHCNLHLKSRTRAVKLQKKIYWNSRKSNFAASRIYTTERHKNAPFNIVWGYPKSFNLAVICQLHVQIGIFFLNKIQFEICLYLLFYEMNKHDAYFAIFCSLFFLTKRAIFSISDSLFTELSHRLTNKMRLVL